MAARQLSETQQISTLIAVQDGDYQRQQREDPNVDSGRRTVNAKLKFTIKTFIVKMIIQIIGMYMVTRV